MYVSLGGNVVGVINTILRVYGGAWISGIGAENSLVIRDIKQLQQLKEIYFLLDNPLFNSSKRSIYYVVKSSCLRVLCYLIEHRLETQLIFIKDNDPRGSIPGRGTDLTSLLIAASFCIQLYNSQCFNGWRVRHSQSLFELALHVIGLNYQVITDLRQEDKDYLILKYTANTSNEISSEDRLHTIFERFNMVHVSAVGLSSVYSDSDTEVARRGA